MDTLVSKSGAERRAPVSAEQQEQLRVWELLVRLVHWSLVLLVVTALLTGFLFRAAWLR